MYFAGRLLRLINGEHEGVIDLRPSMRMSYDIQILCDSRGFSWMMDPDLFLVVTATC